MDRELLAVWRRTRWEVLSAGRWVALPPVQPRALAAVSGFNPGAVRRSASANRSRDAALRRWLARRGVRAARCRGRLGGWCELAWLVDADPRVVLPALRGFGQLAAQVWDRSGPLIAWRTGAVLR